MTAAALLASDGSTEEAQASSSANTGKLDKAKVDAIDAAIYARAHRKVAAATLDGKDGVRSENYEYLDHTADVQLHAWGKTLTEAFEHIVPCMFNYMTDLTIVEFDPEEDVEMDLESHDLDSLLFKLLDEFLFKFSTDYFICKRLQVLEFDKAKCRLQVKAFGEIFDPAKHPQGTEVKAITYSNMQIHVTEDRADIFVIVDI